MFKVKNVRPGILIIADAGLRLEPGRVLEVEELTPHMERAVSAGLLARPEKDEDPSADTNIKTKEETAGETELDWSKLPAAEAISKVGGENDTARLKSHLANEKRRTVIDALKKRLVEVEGGDS
jgi:hypothetical protein